MNIDYLALTTKDTCGNAWDDAFRVKGYLGGEWTESYGRNGYKRSFRHDSGAVILFDGEQGMGLHLVLPSSALAFFSDRLDDLLGDFTWRASRIDVAADTQEVSVGEIVDNQEWVVTRARGRVLVHDLETGGMTLYIGKPGSSRKLVRVYDKGVEQGTHGAGELTRIEVQLRDEYAAAAFEYVRQGGCLADVMLRAVDFRQASRVRKVDRPRLDWWQDIVKAAAGGFVFPVVARALECVESVRRWIEKQVAPSLAKCDLAFGRSWLHGVVFRGVEKIDFSFYSGLGMAAVAST